MVNSLSYSVRLAAAACSHLWYLLLTKRVQLSEVPLDILRLQKLQILDLSQNSLIQLQK